jgi:hypothetical protein
VILVAALVAIWLACGWYLFTRWQLMFNGLLGGSTFVPRGWLDDRPGERWRLWGRGKYLLAILLLSPGWPLLALALRWTRPRIRWVGPGP